MRKFLFAGLLILFAFAVPAVGHAQTVSPEAQAKVAAILAQYPQGGPGLQAAITAAVEADPSLSAAVVAASSTATVVQQQAMGVGLSQAASALAASGTPAGQAGAQEIQQALAGAPATMLVAFAGNDPTAGSSPGGGIGGGSNNSTPSSTCVSGSVAGAHC